MSDIELLPVRPWTEDDERSHKSAMLAEAAYYQRLSAWHYGLMQIMLDYTDFNSAVFPLGNYLWAQGAQRELTRMARRALFATLGS